MLRWFPKDHPFTVSIAFGIKAMILVGVVSYIRAENFNANEIELIGIVGGGGVLGKLFKLV